MLRTNLFAILISTLLLVLLRSSDSVLAEPLAGDSDPVLLNLNATESNVSLSKPKEGSFADMIDKALENEFKENDQNEGYLDPFLLSLSLSAFRFELNKLKKISIAIRTDQIRCV